MFGGISLNKTTTSTEGVENDDLKLEERQSLSKTKNLIIQKLKYAFFKMLKLN
jgi:hypothetical protein